MDPDLMTDDELADRARVGIVTCQHCGMPTRVDLEDDFAQCRKALAELEGAYVDCQLERDEHYLKWSRTETALAAFRAFVRAWDAVEHKLGFCLSFTSEKQCREARAAVEPYMAEGE
jgi:hypothetical protein